MNSEHDIDWYIRHIMYLAIRGDYDEMTTMVRVVYKQGGIDAIDDFRKTYGKKQEAVNVD